MPVMNIEVEMQKAEQLALIMAIRRVLKDERILLSPTGRRALFMIHQGAINAVEVKGADEVNHQLEAKPCLQHLS